MAEKTWSELIRDLAPDLDRQNRTDLEYPAGDTALVTATEALRQFDKG